jgi:hypothetical protein
VGIGRERRGRRRGRGGVVRVGRRAAGVEVRGRRAGIVGTEGERGGSDSGHAGVVASLRVPLFIKRIRDRGDTYTKFKFIY